MARMRLVVLLLGLMAHNAYASLDFDLSGDTGDGIELDLNSPQLEPYLPQIKEAFLEMANQKLADVPVSELLQTSATLSSQSHSKNTFPVPMKLKALRGVSGYGNRKGISIPDSTYTSGVHVSITDVRVKKLNLKAALAKAPTSEGLLITTRINKDTKEKVRKAFGKFTRWYRRRHPEVGDHFLFDQDVGKNIFRAGDLTPIANVVRSAKDVAKYQFYVVNELMSEPSAEFELVLKFWVPSLWTKAIANPLLRNVEATLSLQIFGEVPLIDIRWDAASGDNVEMTGGKLNLNWYKVFKLPGDTYVATDVKTSSKGNGGTVNMLLSPSEEAIYKNTDWTTFVGRSIIQDTIIAMGDAIVRDMVGFVGSHPCFINSLIDGETYKLSFALDYDEQDGRSRDRTRFPDFQFYLADLLSREITKAVDESVVDVEVSPARSFRSTGLQLDITRPNLFTNPLVLGFHLTRTLQQLGSLRRAALKGMSQASTAVNEMFGKISQESTNFWKNRDDLTKNTYWSFDNGVPRDRFSKSFPPQGTGALCADRVARARKNEKERLITKLESTEDLIASWCSKLVDKMSADSEDESSLPNRRSSTGGALHMQDREQLKWPDARLWLLNPKDPMNPESKVFWVAVEPPDEKERFEAFYSYNTQVFLFEKDKCKPVPKDGSATCKFADALAKSGTKFTKNMGAKRLESSLPSDDSSDLAPATYGIVKIEVPDLEYHKTYEFHWCEAKDGYTEMRAKEMECFTYQAYRRYQSPTRARDGLLLAEKACESIPLERDASRVSPKTDLLVRNAYGDAHFFCNANEAGGACAKAQENIEASSTDIDWDDEKLWAGVELLDRMVEDEKDKNRARHWPHQVLCDDNVIGSESCVSVKPNFDPLIDTPTGDSLGLEVTYFYKSTTLTPFFVVTEGPQCSSFQQACNLADLPVKAYVKATGLSGAVSDITFPLASSLGGLERSKTYHLRMCWSYVTGYYCDAGAPFIVYADHRKATVAVEKVLKECPRSQPGLGVQSQIESQIQGGDGEDHDGVFREDTASKVKWFTKTVRITDEGSESKGVYGSRNLRISRDAFDTFCEKHSDRASRDHSDLMLLEMGAESHVGLQHRNHARQMSSSAAQPLQTAVSRIVVSDTADDVFGGVQDLASTVRTTFLPAQEPVDLDELAQTQQLQQSLHASLRDSHPDDGMTDSIERGIEDVTRQVSDDHVTLDLTDDGLDEEERQRRRKAIVQLLTAEKERDEAEVRKYGSIGYFIPNEYKDPEFTPPGGGDGGIEIPLPMGRLNIWLPKVELVRASVSASLRRTSSPRGSNEETFELAVLLKGEPDDPDSPLIVDLDLHITTHGFLGWLISRYSFFRRGSRIRVRAKPDVEKLLTMKFTVIPGASDSEDPTVEVETAFHLTAASLDIEAYTTRNDGEAIALEDRNTVQRLLNDPMRPDLLEGLLGQTLGRYIFQNYIRVLPRDQNERFNIDYILNTYVFSLVDGLAKSVSYYIGTQPCVKGKLESMAKDVGRMDYKVDLSMRYKSDSRTVRGMLKTDIFPEADAFLNRNLQNVDVIKAKAEAHEGVITLDYEMTPGSADAVVKKLIAAILEGDQEGAQDAAVFSNFFYGEKGEVLERLNSKRRSDLMEWMTLLSDGWMSLSSTRTDKSRRFWSLVKETNQASVFGTGCTDANSNFDNCRLCPNCPSNPFWMTNGKGEFEPKMTLFDNRFNRDYRRKHIFVPPNPDHACMTYDEEIKKFAVSTVDDEDAQKVKDKPWLRTFYEFDAKNTDCLTCVGILRNWQYQHLATDYCNAITRPFPSSWAELEETQKLEFRNKLDEWKIGAKAKCLELRNRLRDPFSNFKDKRWVFDSKRASKIYNLVKGVYQNRHDIYQKVRQVLTPYSSVLEETRPSRKMKKLFLQRLTGDQVFPIAYCSAVLDKDCPPL